MAASKVSAVYRINRRGGSYLFYIILFKDIEYKNNSPVIMFLYLVKRSLIERTREVSSFPTTPVL